ncbi:uncharacterized protein HMPREF1541_05767 [Cyphellophora europaea CBS 101466]|uniref:Uncharacterized protein n=1 Tax=Cyphellophora europaea (strain CBS 101466) TaxID=1220924 RepID=W2RSQ5_CYPE1|nr:uncharacterized protein HMPREF1541_05767 [Cyphellophora europaea CBS 101466]ETN39541.1 hypothetical protein HMPREF1541_05767 [Cyphellophora europaea CBS 101466]
MPAFSPSGLYGLVDMGSNGIRFSITDVGGPTARSLPTVYQDRTGVSLYDAQYAESNTKGPIPQATIDEVVAALRRFRVVCKDFGVPETNVRVLATEATRTAVNSEDFRKQIKDATGWEVDMLSKEMEGRIGAMGVASSFKHVEGLVMDLGGGSTQLTYLTTDSAGTTITSPIGSISFPYGAAALTQQLSTLSSTQGPSAAKDDLASTIKSQFRQAYSDLQLPESLRRLAMHHGLTLYLSGGGFRGWGFLHMSRHKVSPYPIPIINGFSISKHAWSQTTDIEELAALAVRAEEGHGVFRVSKRRAAQVPAVAFLVNCVVEALPFVRDVRFCQGGVREGFLYDSLPPAVKMQDPLCAATSVLGPEDAGRIAEVLCASLPGKCYLDRQVPAVFSMEICRAIADCMYLGSSHTKETRSLNALMMPLTGALAGVHGVGHSERAVLALALRRRWDGEVPKPWDEVVDRLRGVLSPQEGWWAEYLGVVAGLLGEVYPAGRVGTKARLKVASQWAEGLGKKGLYQGVRVRLRGREGEEVLKRETLTALVEGWEKVGKKKHWVRGFGVPVEVDIELVPMDEGL